MPKRYPLDWPRQQERTLPAHRTRSRFSSKSLISQWHEIEAELMRFGADDWVISTNVPLKMDGSPRGDARPDGGDPGVAVYFERDGVPYVMAVDQFFGAWENARAIAMTIESLRRLERYGSEGLEAPPPKWWVVLERGPDGAPRTAVAYEFNDAYRRALEDLART